MTIFIRTSLKEKRVGFNPNFLYGSESLEKCSISFKFKEDDPAVAGLTA